MRLSQILLASMLVLLASACQKPIEMTSQIRPGAYKIAYIDIQPENQKMAEDPEYIQMRPLILAELQKKLPYYGHPPMVGLKVKMSWVNTSINPVQAIAVGDAYYLRADMQLWDIQTKKELAKTTAAADSHGVGGVGGLFIHGAIANNTDLKQNLAEDFVQNILEQLYPKEAERI